MVEISWFVLPSVKLSPNARNVVLVSCGMGVTTTWKVQLALCERESLASQVTGVVPYWNSVPDAGVQVTVTGGEPLTAVGTSKDTVGFCPLCAVTLISAGQLTTGSSMVGVGCTVEAPL